MARFDLIQLDRDKLDVRYGSVDKRMDAIGILIFGFLDRHKNRASDSKRNLSQTKITFGSVQNSGIPW